MRHLIVLCLAAVLLAAQQPVPEGPRHAPSIALHDPPHLTLQAAIALARSYNQEYLQSYIAASLAQEDRVQARAALFPTLTLLSQYIYTQGNGTDSGVFVSNDGVHIYNQQAVVHAEVFSFAKRADYQRAVAAEVAARARQDLVARGMVAVVVQNYYGLITAQRHEANARQSLAEARNFLEITAKQERGGEVARADVIKARLQLEQRERDLVEGQSAVLKAKLALGVVLFANLSQPYSVVDDIGEDLTLPPLDDLRVKAESSSPDIRSAEAGVRQARASVGVARGAYYPTFNVDYFYGINAHVLNTRGPDDRRNLGSAVQGTVAVPVWNWGATHSRVRQAQLVQQQAGYDLNFARRRVESSLEMLYLEAQAAKAQLDSLRSSLALSRESLRLTLLRYQAGEATALEVADAQSTLAGARNAHDDGLARLRVALSNLEVLTGRLRP